MCQTCARTYLLFGEEPVDFYPVASYGVAWTPTGNPVEEAPRSTVYGALRLGLSRPPTP